MRFLVNIPPFTAAPTVVTMARDAEEAGWDGVFLWDHLQWSSPPMEAHDPWVLLGAIAQVTERVTLGTLVTPLSRRRPVKIAKEITTLDHLSGGRAVLGVGLGAPDDLDFGDLGEIADRRERAVVLDEHLDLVDRLLRGGRVDHDGEHAQVHGELRPTPVQRPRPPIWVAAVVPNQKPLARARRYEGLAPIGKRELLLPDQLAAYLGDDRPDGWDVVTPFAPGVPAGEYADAGATWLTDSCWPHDTGWEDELHARIRRGPRHP